MKFYPIKGKWVAPGLFSPNKGTVLMGGYKVDKSDFASDGLSGPLKALATLDLERFGEFFPAALSHDWKCAGNVPGMTFTRANDELKQDFIILGMGEDEAESVRLVIEECGTDHWDSDPKPVKNIVKKLLSIGIKFVLDKLFKFLLERFK